MGENNCRGCRKRKIEVQLGFMPRGLCRECFCNNVEKRIRKYIRLSCPLKKGDTLSVLDDRSLEAQVLLFALKNLERDFPFKMRVIKRKPRNITRLVLPWNLDDTVVSFLKGVTLGTPQQKAIAPLSVVHSKEVRLFAKYRGLRSPSRDRIGKEGRIILRELNKIEKNHPNVKFSVLNFSHSVKDQCYYRVGK